MKLTIHGAARQVTGSMHLLEIDQYKILVDCGLDYEKDRSIFSNENFPFDPAAIDVVVLTHAHIDHSGNLPTLVRLGFEGQILCTPATSDLTELLLMDSVRIFTNKIEKSRKHNRKRRDKLQQPLYLAKHVMDTMERFVTVGFNRPFRINGDIELTFVPVGHLLGAAAAVLKINDGGEQKTIAFTGDIGRKNYPVLNDPQELPQVDYLSHGINLWGPLTHQRQNRSAGVDGDHRKGVYQGIRPADHPGIQYRSHTIIGLLLK